MVGIFHLILNNKIHFRSRIWTRSSHFTFKKQEFCSNSIKFGKLVNYDQQYVQIYDTYVKREEHVGRNQADENIAKYTYDPGGGG
jgi:hypothetical protein